MSEHRVTRRQFVRDTAAGAAALAAGISSGSIVEVGNAAGIGAKLALISYSKRLEAQEISRQVGYLELATVPQFAKTFARATYIG